MITRRRLTNKNEPNEVTISIGEYKELKADQAFLRALQASGVNNWHGYDEALESFREDGGY